MINYKILHTKYNNGYKHNMQNTDVTLLSLWNKGELHLGSFLGSALDKAFENMSKIVTRTTLLSCKERDWKCTRGEHWSARAHVVNIYTWTRPQCPEEKFIRRLRTMEVKGPEECSFLFSREGDITSCICPLAQLEVLQKIWHRKRARLFLQHLVC